VQYIPANVPQAWALGSVFHLLQAMLGLQADAPNRRLYVDPEQPNWLLDLTFRQLASRSVVHRDRPISVFTNQKYLLQYSAAQQFLLVQEI